MASQGRGIVDFSVLPCLWADVCDCTMAIRPVLGWRWCQGSFPSASHQLELDEPDFALDLWCSSKQCDKFWASCPSVSWILTWTCIFSLWDCRFVWLMATPPQEVLLTGCKLQKQTYCWKRFSKWLSLPILFSYFQEPHGHLMLSLVHRKWTPGWIKGHLMGALSLWNTAGKWIASVAGSVFLLQHAHPSPSFKKKGVFLLC